MKAVWVSVGILMVILGVVGLFLPVVPTTPFLLLASACFVRSSPRLHAWLLGSRLFGPFLRDWEKHRGVRPHVKIVAVCMILTAVASSYAVDGIGPLPRAILAILAACGLWVVMRLKVITD